MARTADDRGNSAQDVLEMSYGYNAKGELVHVGKQITPETIAKMDAYFEQKAAAEPSKFVGDDTEALAIIKANSPQKIVWINGEEYVVTDTSVATGDLYKPDQSHLS